jgi:hypothetical protein
MSDRSLSSLSATDHRINLDNIGEMITGGAYSMMGGESNNPYNFSKKTQDLSSRSMFYGYLFLSLIILIIVNYQAFVSLKEENEEDGNDEGSATYAIKVTLAVFTAILWIASLYCGFSENPGTDFWAKLLIMMTGFFQLSLLMYSRAGTGLVNVKAFGYNCSIFLILLQVGFGVMSIPTMNVQISTGAFKDTIVARGYQGMNRMYDNSIGEAGRTFRDIREGVNKGTQHFGERYRDRQNAVKTKSLISRD